MLVAGAVIIVIFAIVIVAIVQDNQEKPSEEIVTVGPVWNGPTWTCTSDSDYIVYGTLRSPQIAQLAISISGLGSQSFYTLDPGKMESFTVGSPSNHTMTIAATGTISGWFTLQTSHGAKASCMQP